MPDEAKVVEAKAHQREAARYATREALLCKKRAVREFELALEPGEAPQRFRFRALGAKAYDRLLTANAPTPEQRARAQAFNPNTFAPALLAAVCEEPALSESDWTEVFASEDWSGGELGTLFNAALELCGQGFDLTPIEAD